ncbi:hypothetical protein SteCoe_36046 [Stentor coeruleus]|uniref:Uncharacterized protein n=1 Tax=Stentor coeruleus TaxID=5963 RepID=A0A1R2AR16_9CILI|nr:hypothetical protein SteCoe_36046 [Stentor coeruleus]
MDRYKSSKLKYLNLIAKRIKFLAFHTWKIKFPRTKAPKKQALKKYSSLCLSPEPTPLSLIVGTSKIIHRSSGSYVENLNFTNARQTPHPTKNSRPESPISLSLFDEIKSSLKSKAAIGDSSKDLSVQKTQEKLGNYKKQLFHSGSTIIKHRHKRNSTIPEGELAVVSSKVMKQHSYKVNVIDTRNI